jgi:hypothetical protein
MMGRTRNTGRSPTAIRPPQFVRRGLDHFERLNVAMLVSLRVPRIAKTEFESKFLLRIAVHVDASCL